MTVTGRLVDASNVTLLGTVKAKGVELSCVYKPVRGERPLWEFPDGTLAGREVASYLIARAAGWDCVPPTLLRDGRFGPGMVQAWVEDADSDLTADLLPDDAVPDHWFPVLHAVGQDDEPLVLAHGAQPALAVLAGFDLVVNNADRKASHILPTPDGRIRGVDHGVTLHTDDKLRTILWGWAGSALPDAVTAGLERLASALSSAGSELSRQIDDLVTVGERRALSDRVAHLLAEPVYPRPPEHRTPIPWPPL